MRFRGQGLSTKDVRNLMVLYLEGRSPGTIRNYNSEIKKLVSYFRKKRWNPLILSEGRMGKYLVSRASKGMSQAQMSSLSAGVNFLSEITGFSNPFNSPIIGKIKKAVLKRGYRFRPKRKAPVLTLNQFREIVQSCYDPIAQNVPFTCR